MKGIAFIPVETLISHELVDMRKVDTLVLELSRTRVLRRPIIVEKKSRIVLDGHHRVAAFRLLGIGLIPSVIVPYEKIHVDFRRKSIEQQILKAGIIRHIRDGGIFPIKTTKHRLPKIKKFYFKLHIDDNHLNKTCI